MRDESEWKPVEINEPETIVKTPDGGPFDLSIVHHRHIANDTRQVFYDREATRALRPSSMFDPLPRLHEARGHLAHVPALLGRRVLHDRVVEESVHVTIVRKPLAERPGAGFNARPCVSVLTAGINVLLHYLLRRLRSTGGITASCLIAWAKDCPCPSQMDRGKMDDPSAVFLATLGDDVRAPMVPSAPKSWSATRSTPCPALG